MLGINSGRQLAPWKPSPRLAAVHLILVLILAATLRVPNLGRQETDEWATIATHREGSIRKILASWRDHPCANLAAFACVKVAWAWRGGEYPLWAGKLPSLAAGLGAIWLLYATARRDASHVAAMMAALFLAASKQHATFSTSMRGYSFQVFGVLAMIYCFWRALEGGPRGGRWWVAYGVCVVLAAWSHLWALLVMAGQGVYLLLMGWPRARKWAGWAEAPGVVAGIGSMVAATVMVGGLFAPMWGEVSGVVTGDPISVGTAWRNLNWSLGVNLDQARPYPSDLLTWGLAAVVFCGLLRGALKSRLGSLSACLLATVALILVAHPPGAFGSRYLLFLPALYLLMGAACLRTFPRVADSAGEAGRWPGYLPAPLGNLAVFAATGMVALGLGCVVVASWDAADGTLRELPGIHWPDAGAVVWVVVALQARITRLTRGFVLAVGAGEFLYFATTVLAELLDAPLLEMAQMGLVLAITVLFVPFLRTHDAGRPA